MLCITLGFRECEKEHGVCSDGNERRKEEKLLGFVWVLNKKYTVRPKNILEVSEETEEISANEQWREIENRTRDH